MKLALVFQVHGDSEVSFASWQQHKDYPFTPEGCAVFEVVVYRQANIDVVIRPLGGRTGAAPFEVSRTHQLQNRQSEPGTGVSCRLTRLTSRREFAGLSVWQPHTEVNTQKGETGSESWWTLLECLAPTHPPWVVSSMGFLFSRHWRCHVVTTLLKDSQQSVVHH